MAGPPPEVVAVVAALAATMSGSAGAADTPDTEVEAPDRWRWIAHDDGWR